MEDKKNTLADYYKHQYEQSLLRQDELVSELADKEKEIADLQHKLDRIKNNPLWKITYPAREIYHVLERTKDRLVRCGSVIGVIRKVKSKMKEKGLSAQHGTASFPSPEERIRQQNTVFFEDVTFSILVPLYNTPKKFLIEMIDSVIAQTYGKWELCLADGSDVEHAYVGQIVQEYMSKDARVKYSKIEKNLGISGNTNICLEMATGNYVALFDHDDIMHPAVLYEYMKAICEKGADYIYCDEVTFQGKSIDNIIVLHFKPDYSIDNLRANNYICHFSAFKKSLIDKVGGFRSEYDGSQDHDLILRLTDEAKNIVHVQKVLYYWRSHKGSVASDIKAKEYAIDAAKRAVVSHLKYHGLDAAVMSTKAFPTIFRIKYQLLEKPKVSIIIANKDHPEDLRRCVDSILTKSTYENYEIVIVENNSSEQAIFDYYKEIENFPNIKIVTYTGKFNYSAINNLGVQHSDGKYVLLLNNDTQVITRDWIEELLMYAQRSDVGAVGAKLYYGDNTIQHAGIVIGLGAHRSAGHTHYRETQKNLGYMGRLCYAQNASAVTGACLMVARELYDQVGGLDEDFKVALNDVDFCLKLRKLGYLNIFTPFCEMYHFESKSRGLDDKDEKAERYNEEVERFRERWKVELAAGDPYYNPNFSLNHSNYMLKDWATETQ